MAAGLMDRLRQQCFQPVPAFSLAVFRISFGLLMIWEAARYFKLYRIERYYIFPEFHFKYYGFEWVQPWPGAWMYLHYAVMALAALAIAVGLFYRVACIIYFLLYTQTFLIDQSHYNNHYYLICLIALLLIFIPTHHLWSYDARRKGWECPLVPAWCLWLIQFQIGIVYFYGGLAKIDPEWLRGQPTALWLADSARETPWTASFVLHPAAVYVVAWGGMIYDLLVVPGLMWKRTRIPVFLITLFFHASNTVLFSIGVFPLLATAASTIFFSPCWPLKFFPQKHRKIYEEVLEEKEPFYQHKWVFFVLMLYVGIQLLVPFRHWLYPGNASWTEEGHYFAWRMKLRDKEGDVKVIAGDRETRAVKYINYQEYIESHQAGALLRPHLTIQFAHHLAEMLKKEEGWQEPYVMIQVQAWLNDRKPQPLIDPTVNLSAEPITWRHYDWIVPLKPRVEEAN
jgi:uncharacterized membrane protein YphA (DoxX/SURF4 family)